MKFETLNTQYKKRIIIGILICIIIGVALIITSSLANFRSSQTIPLVNGSISFKPYDLMIEEIYVRSGDSFVSVDTIPDGGSLNSENSYCTRNDVKLTDVVLSYDVSNKILYLTNYNQNRVKCYLYFETDGTSPVITEVKKTSTDKTSITVSVSATDDSQIVKYYYSINNGAYTESTSSTYTFSDLAINTSYTIKVYVEDEYGNQSNVNTSTFSTSNYSCSVGELVGTKCVVSASSQGWYDYTYQVCPYDTTTTDRNCDKCGCEVTLQQFCSENSSTPEMYQSCIDAEGVLGQCVTCGLCTYTTGTDYYDCSYYSYYCASGWSVYSGYDSSLQCSKPAS